MRTVQAMLPNGERAELRRYESHGRDLYIDRPLSNILMTYRQEGFIADQIMPIVGVDQQSGVFFQYNQEDMWRIPDTTRAPLTAAKPVVPFRQAVEWITDGMAPMGKPMKFCFWRLPAKVRSAVGRPAAPAMRTCT